MEYVKPNMNVVIFDRRSINTGLYNSPGNSESEEGGGNCATVPEDMWD